MPTNDKHAQISDKLDDTMLELVTEGRAVMGPGGDTIRVTASAADLRIIMTRLNDLGITKEVTKGSSAAQLAAIARAGLKFNGGKIPPMREEEVA